MGLLETPPRWHATICYSRYVIMFHVVIDLGLNLLFFFQFEIELYIPKKTGDSQQCSRSANDRFLSYVNKRPVQLKEIEKVLISDCIYLII